MPMVQQLSQGERDLVIWGMRRHASHAKIAKRLGVSVKEVQASLRRTGRLRGGYTRSGSR